MKIIDLGNDKDNRKWYEYIFIKKRSSDQETKLGYILTKIETDKEKIKNIENGANINNFEKTEAIKKLLIDGTTTPVAAGITPVAASSPEWDEIAIHLR